MAARVVQLGQHFDRGVAGVVGLEGRPVRGVVVLVAAAAAAMMMLLAEVLPVSTLPQVNLVWCELSDAV